MLYEHKGFSSKWGKVRNVSYSVSIKNHRAFIREVFISVRSLKRAQRQGHEQWLREGVSGMRNAEACRE